MAGVRFSLTSGEVNSGTATLTVLQLVAASNHRVLVDEIGVSFQGTSATNAPVLVEVLRQSTAGTMSSWTPKKLDASDDETLGVTGQVNATAEPTAGEVLMTHLVHPQSGFTWQAPFGRQIHVGGGTRLGLRITATVAVDCVARFVGEE